MFINFIAGRLLVNLYGVYLPFSTFCKGINLYSSLKVYFLAGRKLHATKVINPFNINNS